MLTKVLNVMFTIVVLTILYFKFRFSTRKGLFWEQSIELASNKDSYWYANKAVLFYLLTNALESEDDMKLCLLYNNFKDIFLERETPSKYMQRMQKACRKENTPDTFASESRRIDWNNLN